MPLLLSMSMFNGIVLVLTIAFCLINALFAIKYLHVFQLKDYSCPRYLNYILKKQSIYISICILLAILIIVFKNEIVFLTLACLLLMIIPIFNFKLIEQNKTPIHYTNKFKRLLTISIVLIIILSFVPYGVIFINLVTIFIPILSKTLNLYDIFKNKHYIHKACEKLRLNKTKVIAITGSNGKTSVKNILEKMLSKKYKVCATPKSYNTPLGISKFINDSLVEDCEFLILEYGARRRGDIKKLCKLFGVDYGIITTVAPQHLETFKTIENVYKEKNELSEFLSSGTCVFNTDNLYTYRMYQEKQIKKIGVSIYNKCDVYASNVKIEDFKTKFDLHILDKIYTVETCLLGRHNVLNILLATALAKNLDVEYKDIIDAIKNLKFVPHRLELIKSDLYILDDSYNCSLASAKESVRVLNEICGDLKNKEKNLKNLEFSTNFDKNFTKNNEKLENLKNFYENSEILLTSNTKSKNTKLKTSNENIASKISNEHKRIICTPGIIEGGKCEYDINFQLGKMCSNSDAVIIIGEHNKKAIYSGLKSQNYADNNIVLSSTLENAKAYFKNLNSGDILLLLNDLPDDYN